MRRRRNLVFSVLLAALVLVACGGGDSGETAGGGGGGGGELLPVTFRLDWIADGSHTCYYAAQSNGYFRDEGLDVTILEGAGSGTTATLIANGSDDFGFSDAGVVAKTINDGGPLVMVADIFQRNPSVIISLSKNNIEGPEDLVGKTVGGSTGEAPLQLLPAYLNANGVNPDDVQVVNVDPAAKPAAVLEERVDAIVGYSSSDLPIIEAEAPDEINVQYYADHGVVTLSNGIIVSQDFAESDPEAVRGFVTAVQRGFEFCQEDPDAAVELLVNTFPMTVNPDQAQIALREVLANLYTDRTEGQPIGYMDTADWQDTLDTLAEYSGLADPQAPEEYFTNEFVE
jgi:NitT/TauT family transport system substrate-binding protein